MKQITHWVEFFLLMIVFTINGTAQENPQRIDFSADTAVENKISIMGAGFGAYPMPDIAFGSIPTDNAFTGATDGRGMIIQADPGEGVMILGQSVTTSSPVFMRCAIRANASHASVYLASIDQGENAFVSTITPNQGAYFLNRYKWISDFYLPPSTGFQPLIQIVNTSQSEPLTVYLDNFEFYPLESGKYFSADFLDGDENDPSVIAITPEIPTPTPVSTSTPTPTFTPTSTPTYTPSPTPTPNTEPDDHGIITFYGVVTSSETKLPISGAIITISGDSIESQVTLSTENGNYSISIYGYFFDYFDIVVEYPGYNKYQTLSDYDPRSPQTQLNNIVLVRTPGPTPTPTPIPSQQITVNLTLPDEAIPLEMVWIPSGRFEMGSPENEIGRSDDEMLHTVVLTQGFYIGKYEITQAQWKSVMGNNPSDTIGINKPIDKVSWIEAQQFIDTLNTKNLGTFRLPTEAEWEYACRAGSTTRYYWGEDPQYTMIDQYAWYELHDGLSSHEVGSLLPNAWGLHDMLGNVFEWCSDYYAPYPDSLQINPVGPTTGEEKIRRGGSWLSLKDTCRVATRSKLANYMRSKYIGFRIVRER